MSAVRHLTKYPALFAHTYWGCSGVEDALTTGIVENRNRFVEEFLIKKSLDGMRIHVLTERMEDALAASDVFDHRERYKTEDNRIIFVISPYMSDIPDRLKAFGFRLYNKLYHHNASTFLVEFNDYQDMKARVNIVENCQNDSFFDEVKL